MKRNILIVEDNKAHIDALCKIISSIPAEVEIFCASNVTEGYKFALENHIHLFLVDIMLQSSKPSDVSGLNFVQEIREVSRYEFAPVVFITSLEDPRLLAYSQLHCYQYIEKPFDPEQVKRCVSTLLKFLVTSNDSRSLFLKKDGITYSVKYKDIIYIEGSRRKLKVHCVDEILEIPYKTFSDIIKELDTNIFIQCSRAIVINKSFIKYVDRVNRYVKLRQVGDTIEIGFVYLNRVLKEIDHEHDS